MIRHDKYLWTVTNDGHEVKILIRNQCTLNDLMQESWSVRLTQLFADAAPVSPGVRKRILEPRKGLIALGERILCRSNTEWPGMVAGRMSDGKCRRNPPPQNRIPIS